jgi:peptidoglycan/LPS O-acetylase OafA/YrhL/lysophospholipase L1-like esterase
VEVDQRAIAPAVADGSLAPGARPGLAGGGPDGASGDGASGERAPAEVTPAPGLGYQPALDGLRGLAVLAIVAFHAQVPGAQGAFLGVSTFFTLSGFLITTITLADHRRTGQVPIRRFYARRARRLLPAALATIAIIVGLTVVVGVASQVVRLRADALGALFYVTNWRQIAAGDSYGAIFTSPSMFVHFWSLGIEEQFYIVFPLALAAALWLGRGRRRVLVIGAAVAAVGSTLWSAHLLAGGAGTDRDYFGTDTRLAELAIGCLLALAWDAWATRPPATADGHGGGRRRIAGAGGRVVEWAGVVGLVGIVGVWHLIDRADQGLYRGGLFGYAVLSAAVILAAVRPRGPVHGLLAWRPLVYVGTISYGVYLIHWPIMVVLRQETSLPWQGILAVALVLTLLVATASYRWLERPVRARRWPPPRVAPALAMTALAASAVGILGVTVWRTAPSAPDYEAAARRLNDPTAPAPSGSTGSGSGGSGDDITAAFDRLAARQAKLGPATSPRFAIFGDSSAMMTGLGLSEWSLDHLSQLTPGYGAADLGCGLIDTGSRKVDGEAQPVPASCKGWKDRWVAAVAAKPTDIAMIQFGPWDVRDQQIEPGGPFLTIGKDAALDEALTANLDEAVTDMLAHAGQVVLVAPPDPEFGRDGGRSPSREQPESDPARMEAYRQILAEVAARHPGRAAVVDLAAYMRTRDDDKQLRPDGVHFTEAGARKVAAWLGPEVARLYATAGSPPAR